MIGKRESVSSRLARSRRCVCASSTGETPTASYTNWHFGTTPSLFVLKAINAANPMMPTPEELAQTAPGQHSAGCNPTSRAPHHFDDAAGAFVSGHPADVQGYLNAGRAYLGLGSWSDAGRVAVDGLSRASDSASRRQLAWFPVVTSGGGALLAGGRF